MGIPTKAASSWAKLCASGICQATLSCVQLTGHVTGASKQVLAAGGSLVSVCIALTAEGEGRICGTPRPITLELPTSRSPGLWRRCLSFRRPCRWQSPRLASYRTKSQYEAMRRPQGYCWPLRHCSSSGWPNRHEIMSVGSFLRRNPANSWYWRWGLSFAPLPVLQS